jgi:predicted transcriptional regulator
MQHPYLLPLEHRAIPLSSLRYRGSEHGVAPLLRARDPAASIMVDLQRDSVLTVTEEVYVQVVLDVMFRLGIRLLPVVRENALVGVLSLQDAQQPNPNRSTVAKAACRLRVSDVMVPSALVPVIEWQTLQQCSVGDLAEIFTGSAAQYLVVLEDETPKLSRVRGLIARERLERQLNPEELL